MVTALTVVMLAGAAAAGWFIFMDNKNLPWHDSKILSTGSHGFMLAGMPLVGALGFGMKGMAVIGALSAIPLLLRGLPMLLDKIRG